MDDRVGRWADGPTVTLTLLWEYPDGDGYPAIADVDGNGDPEVVLVGDPAPYDVQDGRLAVLEGATGELWCGADPTEVLCMAVPAFRADPVAIPGEYGRGGPPVVADFDGDGRPEIGVASGSTYSVFDLNRDGEDVVMPPGDPAPPPGAVYTRWSMPVSDQSSNTTGSTAFDFDGDGASEVLYQDECHVRIYDGASGEVKLEQQSSSSTIHEYPVVADVDADGASELLVVANDADAASACGDIPMYTPRRGIFVYGDPQARWMRTRRAWNQHGYHVTNSTASGSTPTEETNNWEHPALDDYRRSSYGNGATLAGDATVWLSAGFGACDQDEVAIIATVRNDGDIALPAGIEVSLYRGVDEGGELVGTLATTNAMPPGGTVELVWNEASNADGQDYFAVVDGEGSVGECIEDNNTATRAAVTCP